MIVNRKSIGICAGGVLMLCFVLLGSRASAPRAGVAPLSTNHSQRQWTSGWIRGQSITPRTLGAVPLQPLAMQIRQVETTLDYLGQPISPSDERQINAALGNQKPGTAVAEIEAVLDRYVLVKVVINPESRVEVARGTAVPDLIQHGTRLFLVKVINQAGVTAPLRVKSPNSTPPYIPAWKDESPRPKERITPQEVRERWAYINLYSKPPMAKRLSGLGVEYRILEIYSRDAGQRSAKINFDVGQGTQDIGFLNDVTILFNIASAHRITLHVLDDNGAPTMASFIFRDRLGRTYPNPSTRLAPDFYFQPQVYRANGESIELPPGSYTVTYTGGPEYVTERRRFTVNTEGPEALTFHLKRWIDPAKYGWYSGDHHIHPAGCSHYVAPSEGVLPRTMMRQVRGEHLNVGCCLIWAPCYYYQKKFFTGRDNPHSRRDEILHYDLEVSGFPSSPCGHLVLLGLKDLEYPGAKRIAYWPTWDLPVLRWAKSQGATVGFAHSGWGLEVGTDSLPNYEMPGFDGVGANEYIVDVTYPNTVNFISAGDTPYVWELNIWYQTLNVGFRTRIAGETDFPCITDNRVGVGRTYAHLTGPLTYTAWLTALRDGRSYVSDGRSHLMDFTVNNTEVGTNGSEVRLVRPGYIIATVKAAAYLDPNPGEAERNGPFVRAGQFPGHAANGVSGTDIRNRPYDQEPYWDIERARIGTTREVPVELVVNGKPVAKRNLLADGNIRDLRFRVLVRRSSWVALRILPSSHTNPIFVIVGGKPVRASRRSAEWCLRAVHQCWSQKSPQISTNELPAAEEAYEHARRVYRKIAAESPRE